MKWKPEEVERMRAEAQLKHGLLPDVVDKISRKELVECLFYHCRNEDHWIEYARKLEHAVYKFWPGAIDCEHDMEPNTTMDYFRCDKCGLPSVFAEALEYEKRNKGPEQS